MGIEIKEPCKEDWSKMTDTERGAFCQKCAIDVIDFTGKSSFQIKSILAHEVSKGTRTCGRMTNQQLDSLNNDFYAWKNDQESFRAIWMVSLIAVFGLSLFSCQNTLSEELVSQMEMEGAQIIAQVDSIAPVDSTEIALTKVDSLNLDDETTLNPFILPPYATEGWQPETHWMGTSPHNDFINWNGDLQTCLITLGMITISGSITVPAKESSLIESFLEEKIALVPDPIAPKLPINRSSHYETSPEVNPSNERTTINSIIYKEGNGKVFEAFIHPNPIEASSRLYINIKEPLEVQLDVHRKENDSPINSGINSFAAGNHKADIGLYKYEKGAYFLKVSCSKQISKLEFTVL